MQRFLAALVLPLLFIACLRPAHSQPFIEPGDPALRHYLALLKDADRVPASLTTWPVSRADIDRSLASIDRLELTTQELAAFAALQAEAVAATGWQFTTSAFAGTNPIGIRSFEDTPRADAGVVFNAKTSAGRISFNIKTSALIEPVDGENFNLDGSYVAMELGNWVASVGWQERWWGPGNSGSLILSTNARPPPGVALQRRHSRAFESRWLSWIGPWSLTTFMHVLDDDRAISDALLWGARVDFSPVASLQIGLSRTAQWCGKGRSCSLGTFSDVLLGNDNRGVNVSVDEEPGNQLAGIDLRWRLPRELPVALYLQWIGEDTRNGGPEIGSWLRLAGAETWGKIAEGSYRLFVEWADTNCREGGAGFSDVKPNCAYRHPLYASGYTYEGRSIGHAADGDSRVFSLGATLVQSANYSWNISARQMDINRFGPIEAAHTVSASPLDITDIIMSVTRTFPVGHMKIGLGYSDRSSVVAGDATDLSGYIRWSSL